MSNLASLIFFLIIPITISWSQNAVLTAELSPLEKSQNQLNNMSYEKLIAYSSYANRKVINLGNHISVICDSKKTLYEREQTLRKALNLFVDKKEFLCDVPYFPYQSKRKYIVNFFKYIYFVNKEDTMLNVSWCIKEDGEFFDKKSTIKRVIVDEIIHDFLPLKKSEQYSRKIIEVYFIFSKKDIHGRKTESVQLKIGNILCE